DDRALLALPGPLRLAVQVKERTCGRERGAPTSIDCAAAEGARSHSTHEWGSLVLGHAVSMVSLGPQGHHDHPSRDSRTLASSRLPSVLAVSIPLSLRPPAGCFRSRQGARSPRRRDIAPKSGRPRLFAIDAPGCLFC